MGAERPERALVAEVGDWPVLAAGRRGDEPVVILHANRVVAASAAARASGVEVGLRRREAQSRCPGAEVVAADPARDARAFEPLVAALDAITPRVEVSRPGLVTLATRGPARYHGGDGPLAERVREVLEPLVPHSGAVRIGVADGAFAAGRAAAAASEAPVIVAPGASPAFVAPLPVATAAAHLGTDEATDIAGVAVRLGLTTLGALAALDPADVLGRFGAEGVLVHRLARGLDPRPLAARRPAPELAVAVELDPPAERVDRLAFQAVTVAGALHARLARDGLACLRIGIEMETEHGELRRRSWRHEGGLSATAVAERARWQLDGWLSGPVIDRPTAGVTRLLLDPEEVVPARGRQLGFWGGESRLDEGAVRALARVAALVGDDAVRIPERRGGRGPGEQVALISLTTADLAGERTARAPGAEGPWPGRLPAPSPALVAADPPAVDLLDASGAQVRVGGRGAISAAPARLGRAEVVAWAGPWPADERWWDPDGARRRARVQVVLADGTAHLLALEDGVWRIEGTYD